MKTIYLLRHAKAEARSPAGDAGRKLAKRGRRAAEAMGILLSGLEPAPELALCSPASRTRETLERVLPALHPPPRIAFEDELYLAEAAAVLHRLRELPETTASVLVIGHNPGLQELAARLAAEPGRMAEDFPTAALAVFRVDGGWAGLRWHSATLAGFYTPKALSRDPEYQAE